MKAKRTYRVRRFGLIARILTFFVDSPLTPLIAGAAILLGVLAVYLLPREEEPQIVVPLVDVFVAMPGSTADEVAQRVTRPLEKLARDLPGVEYVYSTSSPGQALMIVRFLVGWDEEKAIVQLYQKLYANLDRIPPGASPPLLKPRRIDDVPILALTFHGGGQDHQALRRIAALADDAIKEIPEVSETTLIGGQRRQVRVELDASRLTAYGIDPNRVLEAVELANHQLRTGSFPAGEREVLTEFGGFLDSTAAVGGVVVGVHAGQMVYVRDIARLQDGAEEIEDYVLFGRPNPAGTGPPVEEAAVTLAVAKRAGTNAVQVVAEVLRKVETLRGRVIPAGVEVTVTRDYGQTAREKSNELLFHMGLAVAGVSLLIALVLGWREAGVVAIAIPVTLALTLATFYLLGFTLNRVTLFALIFSIGILVDDPIVDVENVVRHFRLPANRGRPLKELTVEAVNEVRSPLILATLTVIAAVLPMAFVQGLMGPYMRPIPVGATAAMLFSMAVAFMITPWAAYRMLRWHAARHAGAAGAAPAAQVGQAGRTGRTGQTGHAVQTAQTRQSVQASPAGQAPPERVQASLAGQASPVREDLTSRAYRRVMAPMIRRPWLGIAFLVTITLLLVGSVALVATGAVKVKMLPFDNKSEFQIIVDMDEGTSLEHTANVARLIAARLSAEPEILNYQIYAGTAAPYNFNGLVRHYFLRRGPHVADIQVNLVHGEARAEQSHAIAKRIRERIQDLAREHQARIKVAEVPPGPPVLQTLVAEVYGPDYGEQIRIAAHLRDLFEATPGVVDVDWYVEADQPLLRFGFDQEKAALLGIDADQVTDALRIAQAGADAGLLHGVDAPEDVLIHLRLPLDQRAQPSELLPLPVCGNRRCVPLGEVVRLEQGVGEKSIHRKNQLPVVYVTADVAGAEESPLYAILALKEQLAAYVPEGRGAPLEILNIRQPFSTAEPAMKWDGEWHISYEVFRDLGAAFAIVLVLIYALVVGWFRSFRTPFIIMAAIPFSLVGILPAHWALGAFFSATSMIGFIAGAGIVVRNSIILVDFIKLRVREGMPLAEAVVDAGAIRFRPMLLTALAVVVGGSVILYDPIFQGLALSLMAGEVASLLLSRMAVPVIYYLAMRHQRQAQT